jgi:hypothetical protein
MRTSHDGLWLPSSTQEGARPPGAVASTVLPSQELVRSRLSVVPRRVPKAPRIRFVSLVSLLLIGGVVGLLMFNTAMQQHSFTATALEERAAALDAHEQSLKMELDKVRDPQQVAFRAKQLGMVPATSPAFIRLEDGKVLGSPTVSGQAGAMRITPLPTVKPKGLRPEPVIVKVRESEEP